VLKRRLVGLTVALATALGSLVAVGATPANAAGSTIDIGYTIVVDKFTIKGSGSDYNTGDFSNVCIVIKASTDDRNWYDATPSPGACRSNLGSNVWSAPDANTQLALPRVTCGWFKTRITALYRGGTFKSWKDSNEVRACSF